MKENLVKTNTFSLRHPIIAKKINLSIVFKPVVEVESDILRYRPPKLKIGVNELRRNLTQAAHPLTTKQTMDSKLYRKKLLITDENNPATNNDNNTEERHPLPRQNISEISYQIDFDSGQRLDTTRTTQEDASLHSGEIRNASHQPVNQQTSNAVLISPKYPALTAEEYDKINNFNIKASTSEMNCLVHHD